MSIQSIVKNELVQDDHMVWRLKEHTQFAYSEGLAAEKYLRKTFSRVNDLGSRSPELESYIKDWTSEYHLSKKRSQLLSGFSFNRANKVLEVGCGCGAITRFLGENFNEVVGVEGNINRARLAKQRSKEFGGVSIICAPFQEINFTQKFDIIFCIGVFEYSASFIKAKDPYEAALEYFSNMLTPDGMVVIAIENQFGLKYFNGAREDHVGQIFEGIEGYHQNPHKVRTFGKVELEDRLKKYFPEVEFFYPFPDYKLADCVMSDEFINSKRSGELISQINSRDYGGKECFLWNESAAILELSKNKTLSFFSNSFLVFAGFSLHKKKFDQEALFYSNNRKPEYSTQTKIIKSKDAFHVIKHKEIKSHSKEQKLLRLIETKSLWIDALSLQTQLYLRAYEENSSIKEIFEICKPWIEFLNKISQKKQDRLWIEGKYLDAIWSNTYIIENECNLVDQEWVWHKEIPLNVLIIRTIYGFLSKIDAKPYVKKEKTQNNQLLDKNGKSLITKISNSMNIDIINQDFIDFIELESQISEIITKKSKYSYIVYLKWFLLNRKMLKAICKINARLNDLKLKIQTKLSNVFSK